MTGRIACLIFATSLAGFSQPAAFEVASIRPGQPGRESIEPLPTSLTMRNVRLVACVGWAYAVPDFQISGPDWIGDSRFDLWAKTAGPVKEAELRGMLQALLADRFKLNVHRQTKEIQALVLTVAKSGHKLEAVDSEGSPSFQTGEMNLTGHGATLSQLTEFISHELRTPIIDQTGLTGRYKYHLDILPYITDEIRKSSGHNGGPPPDAPSIIAQAIQAQLGLKVEAKKAPVEMIVIDQVEKAPTEN